MKVLVDISKIYLGNIKNRGIFARRLILKGELKLNFEGRINFVRQLGSLIIEVKFFYPIDFLSILIHILFLHNTSYYTS